jgi:5-aminopentanamidase
VGHAVGFFQFGPRFGDVEANRAVIERVVREAGAHLLVLPELAVSGYDFPDAEAAAALAEPFETGPTSVLLRDLAGRHRMTIVAGYAERAGENLYNSSMLVTPDGGMHNYRKIHLFSREKLIFTPGDAPPPVIETPVGRVGMMICFDWFYPETARLLAVSGAQIIAHPSNLVLPYCQQAMYARSVENHVFSITANRIGTEEQAGRTLTFTGASQVLNPEGRVLVNAPEAEEFLGLTEIDPAEADNKQINEYNELLKERRVDLYGGLLG